MVRKSPASKITAKGQTTIPIGVRRHLRVRPGDRVTYVIQPDGRVVMMPAALDAKEVAGMLAPAPRRVTIEEMRAAIRKRGSRL